MQMFLFCYPDFLDDGVASEFIQAGYKAHMKLHGATGQDEPHDERQGGGRAPGKLKALFMYMPDENIPRVLDTVRKLKEKYPNEDLRAFTWALQECY